MTTILPCPFCGHADIEIDEIDVGEYAVTCPECETIGPKDSHSPMGAIRLWNVRAPAGVPQQPAFDFSMEAAA